LSFRVRQPALAGRSNSCALRHEAGPRSQIRVTPGPQPIDARCHERCGQFSRKLTDEHTSAGRGKALRTEVGQPLQSGACAETNRAATRRPNRIRRRQPPSATVPRQEGRPAPAARSLLAGFRRRRLSPRPRTSSALFATTTPDDQGRWYTAPTGRKVPFEHSLTVGRSRLVHLSNAQSGLLQSFSRYPCQLRRRTR
jgi:hypothetical protein